MVFREISVKENFYISTAHSLSDTRFINVISVYMYIVYENPFRWIDENCQESHVYLFTMNSLAPWRCGNKFKHILSKFIIAKNTLGISRKIALM